jgi:hypothetical protein
MVALCFGEHISAASTALPTREEREILAQIDMICRCTGLQRKSGVQKVERFNTAEGAMALRSRSPLTEYRKSIGADSPVTGTSPNSLPVAGKCAGSFQQCKAPASERFASKQSNV